MSEYKNRRGWLIFFGVQLVGLGLLTLGMAALVAIGTMLGSHEPQAAPLRIMLPAALIYVAIGATFLALGIGSIAAKRWAPPLTLVLSWMWLISGVLGTAGFLVMAPRMFASLPQDQASVSTFVVGCTTAILAIFFVLLPMVFVLFYRAPSVRATVMALDPTPRWTDAIPLPLLAFVLWMFAGGASFLLMGFMYRALPIGGFVLRGLAVPAVTTAVALVFLFIAYGSLQRKMAAWWTALVIAVAGTVYSFAFLTNTDFSVWYEAMDLPADPQQLELMQAMYSGPFYFAWMGALLLGYFGFLFYVRRYFKTSTG